MSFSIGAIAVKASKEITIRAIFDFFNKNRKLPQIDAIPSDYVTDSHIVNYINGWTIISFKQAGIFPELEIYLSKKLSTKVIAIDSNGVAEYRHFSIVEDGIPTMIFTIGLETDVIENLNVDYENIFRLANSNPKAYKVVKGDTLDDAPNYAYDIFNLFISEINLEELAVKMLEKEDSTSYSFTTTSIRLGHANLNWREIIDQANIKTETKKKWWKF